MIAIYARTATSSARTSPDQFGDNPRSVTRQIEHARAYAAAKGWIVPDEFVYSDEAASGADFTRPGFLRLMNALKPHPPFQVLILSDAARLGRDAIQITSALQQILTAGVRVVFSLEDREFTLDSPTATIMRSLTTGAAEFERE